MEDKPEKVRVWLVERGYNNRDLIILKYATPNGEYFFRRELASQAIGVDTVTAAKDVSPTDLEIVDDPDLRERYKAEVTRMVEKHDPDDSI